MDRDVAVQTQASDASARHLYQEPMLGPPTSIEAATLFSGTINPDAGIVGFGDQ